MNRLFRFFAAALLLLVSQPSAAREFVLGNYRLTFITDHLVRLEYAVGQRFLNDSTLFAVNRRDFPVEVTMKKNGRKHVFTTRAMTVELDNDGFPYGQNNLRISFPMQGKTKGWCLTDGQIGRASCRERV